MALFKEPDNCYRPQGADVLQPSLAGATVSAQVLGGVA